MTLQINHNFVCAKVGVVALFTGALLVATGVAVGTQAPLQPARFNVGVEHYIASFYDALPIDGVRYVFYEGETVQGTARLLNADENTDLIVTVPRERWIEAVWLEAPGRAPILQMEAELSLDDFGARSAAEFERQVHVPPHQQIVVPFEFGTSGLPGGVYKVRFRPRGRDSERPILADYDVLSFEIRERRELVSVVEALYRDVMRAIWNLDMQSAESGVNRMLAVYPDSVLAHSLRGGIARRAGRNADAAVSEGRAKELIDAGRDRLYAARPTRGLVD